MTQLNSSPPKPFLNNVLRPQNALQDMQVSIRLWYWFHMLFIATRVAKTLSPDIHHFDPRLPASYP
jgi:hypothetical protein